MAKENMNEDATLPLETGSEEPTQEKPTKSKKDIFIEGFRKKHPDWQDEDEEGFYGALSDDSAAIDEEMKGYKDRENEITNSLSGSPLNASLFLEASKGTPVPLALLKKYPEEIQSWLNDPNNVDAIEEAFNEHAKRIEDDRKLQAEKESNLEESNSVIDKMISDGEISDDEEANQLIEFLGNIAVGLMMDHVEREWLIAAKKAINHDLDVDAARTQGEIDGRNAKISAQRRENSRGSSNHSGLGSSNAGQRLSARESAEAIGRSKPRSIWDGGKTTELK